MRYQPLAHQQKISEKKDKLRNFALCQLDDEKFEVHEFSPTHYRINRRWDFWPTTGKWWDTRLNVSGWGVDGLIRTIKNNK